MIPFDNNVLLKLWKKISQRKLDSLFNKINHVLENISCLFLEYTLFFESGIIPDFIVYFDRKYVIIWMCLIPP